MVERVRMAEQVASPISVFSGVAQRITAVNKVAKLLEISEEELNAMVARAAKEQKSAASQRGADSAANVVDESAKKLLASQNKTAVLLCQMALSDAEVLHWLREADCEEILNEVPGTELLALLWRSRYDPLDEISRTAFSWPGWKGTSRRRLACCWHANGRRAAC
jgi:DNA primase